MTRPTPKKLSDLQKRILSLKKERKALILAHNYQPLEIQQIADFVGDSLQLAQKSADVKGYEMVVFAGVRFMAEMAAVLSDGLPVYIPAPDALCPLAAWVTPEKIRQRKKEYPGAPVVLYVNTTAEAKAEADIICTSGNAAQVVKSLGAETVLFGPDKNLAEYVRQKTGVKIVDIEPKGNCFVHHQFTVAQLEELRKKHPDATVIVHPECPPDVQAAADLVGSTGMMVKTVAASSQREFIIATELGLIQQLQEAHPDKVIIPAYIGAVCKQMKKTTLEKIARVLEDLPEENLVTVPDHLRERLHVLLDRMNRIPVSGPVQSVVTVH